MTVLQDIMSYSAVRLCFLPKQLSSHLRIQLDHSSSHPFPRFTPVHPSCIYPSSSLLSVLSVSDSLRPFHNSLVPSFSRVQAVSQPGVSVRLS